MEKIYFTGEMIAKNQEAIPFVFVAGPWKLPGNSLAFMAVFAGAWSGMGNTEAPFFRVFQRALASGIDFPTKVSMQLYGEINGKDERLNARGEIWVADSAIHVGLSVDDALVAEAALNKNQTASFMEMLADMESHSESRP